MIWKNRLKKNLYLALALILVVIGALLISWNRIFFPLSDLESPRFPLSPDSPFKALCTHDGNSPEYQCSNPLSDFRCDSFFKPSKAIERIDPSVPIMTCKKSESRNAPSQEGVYRVQGIGWTYNMVYLFDYAVFRNGQFELLRSPEDFKKIFAPVETPEEALGFVEAFNQGNAIFDRSPLLNLEGGTYKISNSLIPETSVSKTSEGYLVKVYTDFGHCVDAVYQKDLLIRMDGEIEERDSTLIWESNRIPSCVS